MRKEVKAMKNLICFLISAVLAVYGYCYLLKDGDELPDFKECKELILGTNEGIVLENW